jgi:hypothetical protein
LSPYPVELIPFEPVNGADTHYGKLYKPIIAHPFKEAGINGFSPLKPYQVTTMLVLTGLCLNFHWPSLSEPNKELSPFWWENDDKCRCYINGDSISTLPILTNGPPPAASPLSIPAVPAIPLLVVTIIQSTNRLLFVLYKISNNDAREWRLAWVAFMDSMLLYPSCMLDGWFLFKFYISHPADWHYNAVNQQYWLQLHYLEDITSPHSTANTHLVRPSETSESYASCHKLLPLGKWLNISHLDTYIHGPVEFATIVIAFARRTGVSSADTSLCSAIQFHCSDVPTFSIHVDRGAHVTFHDQALWDDFVF